MTTRIGTLGDRLLALLVPRARATADGCAWKSCGSGCLLKRCCVFGTFTHCGNCQWTCNG
jgi:hypothetical protein